MSTSVLNAQFPVSETCRVRFAPSPTGYLHVGGARTALFNWLFAKKMGGQFLLRIEDTDRTRYSEEALTNLIAEMKWMGLMWDEGPEVGGPFGPYQQSERLELYNKFAQQLVKEGKAYPCFCTSERLETMRAEQESTDEHTSGYDRHCRHISPDEAEKRIAQGEAHVIRFKSPLNGEVTVKDYLRGNITTPCSSLDDLVLLKTDQFPTYHLASVIDDHDMKITHVLRGEEWIPSSPKHVLLYQAFGWQAPEFVHLPVILNSDGKGKLSKRKGAASVFDHKDMGILPEALFNFLALLGWNPGDGREKMELSDMIEAFSLDRLNSKSAVFDPEKLNWMNGQYLAQSSVERLAPLLIEELQKINIKCSIEKANLLVPHIQERCKFVQDLASQAELFFRLPTEFDEKDLKKATKEGFENRLKTVVSRLPQIQEWTAEKIDQEIHHLVEEAQEGFGLWGMPLRFALTHKLGGVNLPDILAILGREESILRIEQFIQSQNNG